MIDPKEHNEIIRLSVDIVTKLGLLAIILYISYLISFALFSRSFSGGSFWR